MAKTSTNSSLRSAKVNKEDEFYTQLPDIEKELRHYKKHFKNKVVLCNCDDPRMSNFFIYFSLNFEKLGLKKLITTCYKNQQPELFSDKSSEKAVYLIYEGDKNQNNSVDDYEIMPHELKGDGDFRSEECIELLKQADIVVTNPPFSLFREYVAQLMEYDKKFLIMGNQNAITYREIFSLIKENKIWLGVSGGSVGFKVPDYYEPRATRYWETIEQDENGKDFIQKWRSMGNICWFTNLDHSKRHEELILFKSYSENEYPQYDFYDAININKVAEIPIDYKGYMGVPITFMHKYNPEQFQIYGIMNTGEENKGIRYLDSPHGRPTVKGKEIYFRILIKNKKLWTFSTKKSASEN